MNMFLWRSFPRMMFTWRKICRANYEREMELLDVLCDRKRTGVDVGAKVGMYTYRIRRFSSDVVAFEPIPLFGHMLKSVFEGKRGHIEIVAASNTRSKAILRMPFAPNGRQEFGRSTIEPNNRLVHKLVASTQEIEVETRPLDDLNLQNVGFIKIDVEGHELAVLDGGWRTIKAHRPALLVECNEDHHPNAVARLASWLRGHGYLAQFLDGKTLSDIDNYSRAEHWDKRGIENFICTHESCDDVRHALAVRAAQVSG
jgi:FkbM family methyltransferase